MRALNVIQMSWSGSRAAGWKPAIRQVGNLRYGGKL